VKIARFFLLVFISVIVLCGPVVFIFAYVGVVVLVGFLYVGLKMAVCRNMSPL
jgi:hypothetical protein